MRSGRWRWCGWLGLIGSAAALMAGCATSSNALDQALLVNRNPAAHGANPSEQYVVRCPDVLDITVKGRPQWSGLRAVNADGRVGLTEQTAPRVEGQTTPEISRDLERLANVPTGDVTVRVAEYRSQQLYLISDVPGQQSVVPYRGPETIVDLLQRVGGLSYRSAPAEIEVVRAHVADGRPPEVFNVDLAAILLKQDQKTNIALQSFDQIYVGQSRQSTVLSCCPPWLKPLYKSLCGMARREKASQQTKDLMRDNRPNRDPPL
jgi:protein involved in polysaccharide export with SLBB domain